MVTVTEREKGIRMTATKFVLTATVLAGVSTLGLRQASGSNAGGTDVLHYTVSATMTQGGADANAAGSVSASQKDQGSADQQTLTLNVSNLDNSTTYLVRALLNGETNVTDVATFTTGANGAAKVVYSNKGSGKGHGSGTPLP